MVELKDLSLAEVSKKGGSLVFSGVAAFLSLFV